MQKITPFLWFNGNVEAAIDFYTSAFANSKMQIHKRMPDGKAFSASFELEGQPFMALDGGPMFSFTPAISFFVNCDTEARTDELWAKLGEGGKVLMPLNKYPFSQKYGWMQDQFGLSWQLNFTGTNPKISPALLFVKEQNGKAEEAINFYRSLFSNSTVDTMARYEAGEGGTVGSLKYSSFTLDGQEFKAMDSSGDHAFTFTPATSFFVDCKTQDEVDYLWNKLSEGGGKSRCGWLWDKYGVSWQIIPSVLMELLYDKDPAKANRVMQAMLKMDKIDIAGLKAAYAQ